MLRVHVIRRLISRHFSRRVLPRAEAASSWHHSSNGPLAYPDSGENAGSMCGRYVLALVGWTEAQVAEPQR